MISVEVRSSGWGPRKCLRGLFVGHAWWMDAWVRKTISKMVWNWPRDGVAIIIRREA